MKQNITISLEKEVLRKGKILAAIQGTSLTRMVSDKLNEAIQEKETYLRARKKALAQMKKGFHGGGRRPVRDQLHER